MNWTDVLGIIVIGLLFGAYALLSPMLEGKKNGKGNQFGILDEISKKIKNAVRWMNRQ